MGKRNERGKGNGGFTLIELMLVSAIIGLLASIAIPKFGDLILKSKEAAFKADLGMIRSSIAIYYADNEGIFPSLWDGPGHFYPAGFLFAMVPKYLDKFPVKNVPKRHDDVPVIPTMPFVSGLGDMASVGVPYAYPQPAWNTPMGIILINCNHTDSKGSIWSTW